MNAAWVWLLAGMTLMLAEFAIPGFVVFFFGFGAIVTGGLLFVDGGMAFPLQGLIFAVSSVVSLAAFRRFCPRIAHGTEKKEPYPEDDREYAGESALVVEDIAPETPGKIYFHGSLWSAVSDRAHASGEHVVIVERRNITFQVK